VVMDVGAGTGMCSWNKCKFLVFWVSALCYKPEAGGFETRWGEWIFSIYLSFQPHDGPGDYSASN
jgi:hypothetical protein